jgi:NAD-dependent dihydropyrimidine dehydrogenase PreA subunit
MAYVITKPCIDVKDTACVAVFPVDAIHPTSLESDFDLEPMLYINPVDCICCNLCTDECPVKAIFPEEDVPAEFASFIERNAAYYRK